MNVFKKGRIRSLVAKHRLTAGLAGLAALALITAGGVAAASAVEARAALDEFNYDGKNAEQIKAIADCISGVDGAECPAGHDRSGWKQWAEDHLDDYYTNDGTVKLADADGTLTDVSIRLIGVNHDDRADGKGKAGLTFQATSPYTDHAMSEGWSSDGGWRDSDMRKWLNTDVLNSNESVKRNVTPVIKMTDNDSGSLATATVDKIWLLSPVEMDMPSIDHDYSNDDPDPMDRPTAVRPSGGDIQMDWGYWQGCKDYDYAGRPYEYWVKNANDVDNYDYYYSGGNEYVWLRSLNPNEDSYAAYFNSDDGLRTDYPGQPNGVVPALSF